MNETSTIRRGSLSAAVILALVSPLPAAEDKHPVSVVTQSWGIDQGLPTTGVTAITRTRDGYLWVGTRSGLARFDGVRFHSYGFRDGLRSITIRALLEDQRGQLWIGTAGGGLSRLENGRFTTLTVRDGLPSDTVVTLAEDRAGQIWIGTGRGLAIWRDGRLSPPDDNSRLGQLPITRLLCDRDGTMWVAAFRAGIFRFQDGKWLELEGEAERQGLRVCQALYEDRKGRIWAGTDGPSLFRRDPRSATNPTPGWQLFRVPAAEAFTYVESIQEDAAGNIWPSLSAGAPVYFACGEGDPLPVRTRFGSSQILWYFADSDGSLWGADDRGLLRLPRAQVEHYGMEQGLATRGASAVLEIGPGRAWVGAFGGGLFQFESGRFQRVLPDPAFQRYYYINALCQARDGTCWVGTGHGLHQFRDGKRIAGEEFRASFEGDNVFAILEDRDAGIWVGTGSGRLWRWQAGKLTQDQPSSVKHAIMALAQEKDGTLWIGTSGGGLYRRAGDTITRLGMEDGLVSEDISSLFIDSEDRLWIGTHGGGLSWRHRGRLVNCTRREGLPDDNVWQIIDDEAGHLWLGTSGGIVRLVKSDLDEFAAGRRRRVEAMALGRTDGIPDAACMRGMAARGRLGGIGFPTADGIVLVRPSTFDIPEPPPRVKIEEVGVAGTLRDTSGAIHVGKDEPRRLEIRYTALGISAPEQALFRYRLHGLETEWTEAGRERLAVYNQLPPGTYTFQVNACNRGGVWSESGASLTVVVAPRFWETWTFRALMILLAVVLTAGIVARILQMRYRRHMEILKREHALDQERARIAQDIHDDVGARLTQIGFQSALIVRAAETPAALREQVERIRDNTVDVVRALDSIVWAVQPKHDHVRSLVAYLCQVAEELFRDSPIRCRQDVAPDIPDAPLQADRRHQVLLAAKEALHNAARHSQAREVWLRMAFDHGELAITVTDDGTGFTAVGDDGCGLENMQVRMKAIGGTCEIDTAPSGTTVRLRVYIPK
jgi:ligand-binding sensor domain-containing protein/signal transduction histidine kinase